MASESRQVVDHIIQEIRIAEERRMSDPTEAYAQLPRYRSQQAEVFAFKVRLVDPQEDGGALLYGEMSGLGPKMVMRAYVERYQPQAGGYYLIDDQGNESWLPAEPFEAEYTRIP